MDKAKFDELVRSLAEGTDRRSALKKLAGGALGGLVALNAFGSEADARRRRPRRPGNRGNTTAAPTTAAPTTAAPTTAAPICSPATRCDPKTKNSCGDESVCKCTQIYADSGNPKDFDFFCRPVQTCRARFSACKVGATAGSNWECCSADDYCKPLYPTGDRGYCKPRFTCPSTPGKNCRYPSDVGASCGGPKPGSCVCKWNGKTDLGRDATGRTIFVDSKGYWSCEPNLGFKIDRRAV